MPPVPPTLFGLVARHSNHGCSICPGSVLSDAPQPSPLLSDRSCRRGSVMPGGGWTCRRCTFNNCPKDACCDACGSTEVGAAMLSSKCLGAAGSPVNELHPVTALWAPAGTSLMRLSWVWVWSAGPP